MKVVMVLLWIVTLLCACAGGLLLAMAINADAAPAQGAAAAVACGFAVIPYVFYPRHRRHVLRAKRTRIGRIAGNVA